MRILLTLVTALLPVILMVGLIPFVPNDFVLALIYIAIITGMLWIRYEQRDWLVLAVGLIGMTVAEYFFIATGVETFERASLFGIMPVWLPLLWGYGFIAIRRITALL